MPRKRTAPRTALRNDTHGSHFVTLTPIAQFRRQTGHVDWCTCAVCGTPIARDGDIGRTRDYCSPRCRQKAYRTRRTEANRGQR